jgi:hypothetical protein
MGEGSVGQGGNRLSARSDFNETYSSVIFRIGQQIDIGLCRTGRPQ